MTGPPLRQSVPIDGTVYGVALNAKNYVAAHLDAFRKAPYLAPPAGVVLYIKPRNTFAAHGATVQLPTELSEVEASAAMALVFGRDTCAVSRAEALDGVAGYTLAIDLTEPGADFFRPPVREKCRDGFLPVGPTIVPRSSITNPDDLALQLEIDGCEVETFHIANSIRPMAKLIEEVSAFMTFRAGDVLLAALTPPGPRARVGSRIAAVAEGIGRLECLLGREQGAAR